MKTKFKLPQKEFSFAGFDFPKYAFMIPKGNFKKRIEQMKQQFTGPYYHSPKPNNKDGIGFYLDSDFMPGLRWQYCDEIADRIMHVGWFADKYQDTKIRGIVFRLPRNRGFLAGWTMGENMASEIDYTIYANEIDAAYAADSMAESVAENMLDSGDDEE